MNGIDFARAAVEEALRAGCTAADAAAMESEGLEVRVRDGDVERVEESQSRALDVRAFRGNRVGVAFTNDLSMDSVRRAARHAAELASVSAEDPYAGLPDDADLGTFSGDLDRVDRRAGEYGLDLWRELALSAERAAKAHPRVSMSEGARASGGRRTMALVNSHGFEAAYETTSVRLQASMFATGEHGERQRDHWLARAVHLDDLETPEQVGTRAAERAVSRVGWRLPPVGAFPVILSPEVARDFATTLAHSVMAYLVFRRSTFLADAAGKEVGSAALTLVDDSTLPRRCGSRPFDGEGVRGRRTALFERGRVASWLADAYSARRTGTRTTGGAIRTGGAMGLGTTNLVLAPGVRPPDALIGEIESGLYVTDLFGFGADVTTGTWSRGGSGRWIENGRLAHPVQELTVAGNLREMLHGFREAASDLTWQGACAAPTVRIDGLTVAAG